MNAPRMLRGRRGRRPARHVRAATIACAIQAIWFPFKAGVCSVTFSANGPAPALPVRRDERLVWQTGRPIGEPLAGHTDDVSASAFSPDGSSLATAGTGGTVRLWNPGTGQSAGEPLIGISEPVLALAFSPDGSLLAAGGSAKTLWLWDAHTRRPVGRPLTDHTGAVRGLTFSSDGALLATTDGDLRLWELASPDR